MSDKIWRIKDVLDFSSGYLKRHGVQNSRQEAIWLISELLGLSRLDMLMQADKPLQQDELSIIRNGLRKRAANVPLAYICGVQPFRGLRIRVSEHVLVPRPETEQIIDVLWRFIAPNSGARIADIGTGSGCIVLSALFEDKSISAVATDISEQALKVAMQNANELGLSSRLEFRLGDLFDAFRENERFDAIISNPPYVAEGFKLPASVEKEPKLALFAGVDGLSVIRRLVDGAHTHLEENGVLIFEFGFDQADAVHRLVEESEHLKLLELIPDSFGVLRFAVCRKVSK